VLIHFLAAAEFDPVELVAEPFIHSRVFTAALEAMRPRNQGLSAVFQSTCDQRRAHRIKGEHKRCQLPKFPVRRLVQEMGTPQTERLKARAKLSNRILPVSFAKREMTSAWFS
jgi:hypothetical protein